MASPARQSKKKKTVSLGSPKVKKQRGLRGKEKKNIKKKVKSKSVWMKLIQFENSI